MKQSKSSIRLIGTLLLGFFSFSVGAQTLDAPALPGVGDKWTYRFHNKGDKREPYLYSNQIKTIDGDSAWVYSETNETNARYPRSVWRQEMRSAEFVERFEFDEAAANGAGKSIVNRAKNDKWLQFPLAVGKKYTVKRHWDNGNGFDEFTAEVQATEKVKVEGGEFDSYRIRFTGFWNQRVGGNYSGRSENIFWYAPEVKGVVKWLYTNRNSGGSAWNDMTTELVKWEPSVAK